MGCYSAFQIDELYRHNQNLVGTLHATSLLWSTDMKTAVRRSGTRGVVKLLSGLANIGEKQFSHPYYWEGFTMLGSPC